MTDNIVEINLLEKGDYYIKLNHDALENIEVSLSSVPEDRSGGVARALFSASALYCMAGTINYMLKARKIPVKGINGSASIIIGKDDRGRDLVESLSLNIEVDIPDDKMDELDRCIEYLGDGSMITRGLKRGIKVTNNIQRTSE